MRTQPLGNSAFEEFGIRRRRSKSVPRLLPLEDEKGSTESLARWERASGYSMSYILLPTNQMTCPAWPSEVAL